MKEFNPQKIVDDETNRKIENLFLFVRHLYDTYSEEGAADNPEPKPFYVVEEMVDEIYYKVRELYEFRQLDQR